MIDVNSYVFRAAQNIWFMEIDLCICVNAAAVYDVISNNQTAIMLRNSELLSVNFRILKKNTYFT